MVVVEESEKGMSKDEALKIATDYAKAQSVDVDQYVMSSEFHDGVWQVDFTKKGGSAVRGWPSHFSVWVKSPSDIQFFRGR